MRQESASHLYYFHLFVPSPAFSRHLKESIRYADLFRYVIYCNHNEKRIEKLVSSSSDMLLSDYPLGAVNVLYPFSPFCLNAFHGFIANVGLYYRLIHFLLESHFDTRNSEYCLLRFTILVFSADTSRRNLSFNHCFTAIIVFTAPSRVGQKMRKSSAHLTINISNDNFGTASFYLPERRIMPLYAYSSQTLKTTFPIFSPCSSMACASSASRMGKTR